MAQRPITDSESRLLQTLADAVPELHLDAEQLRGLTVEPFDDGDMGSLRLSRRDKTSPRIAAELTFTDADGVSVIASLYVDHDGAPLELDMWKTNYEPLIELPVNLPPARRFSYETER